MKISDSKAKELYDGDIYKCVKAINTMLRSADGLEFMLLKRLRAWISLEQAARNRTQTHKKHTVMSVAWIKDPAVALEDLLTFITEQDLSKETVAGRRIRRKDLSKPFSKTNIIFGA